MSIALPLDKAASPRPEPWVLHILNVNTMNFCAFAACHGQEEVADELLVAVPNTLASESVGQALLFPIEAKQVVVADITVQD